MVEGLEERLLYATYWVTNTDDAGAGSLRQAMLSSNATVGVYDTINFNIDSMLGGVQTIEPLTPLPNITDPCLINGNTQLGSQANQNVDGPDDAELMIQLSGSQLHNAGVNNGLTITAGRTTVRGLIINDFLGNCVAINGGKANHVAGCFLGTNDDGSKGANTFKASGVDIVSSSGNLIGGTAAPDRNLIDDNKFGVRIFNPASTANCVWGNFIGLAADGRTMIANNNTGVFIDNAPGNFVGDADHNMFNVIAGSRSGIEIDNAAAANNLVFGNYIGTDVTGKQPAANTVGVYLGRGAHNNLIGGTQAGSGNVISGNTTHGVELAGGATRNRVQLNLIGVGADGKTSVRNGQVGVLVAAANANFIGGSPVAGKHQIIANNGQDGVQLTGGSSGNYVQGNFIFANRNGVFVNNGAGNFIGTGIPTGNPSALSPGGNAIFSNRGSGVDISGAASSGNKVQANFIGTSDGDSDNANANAGVLISDAPSNTIGGAGAAERNVISANDVGVFITGAHAHDNAVQGNLIGTDSDGIRSLGNKNQGVFIADAAKNLIGGVNTGNVISWNRWGVTISGPTSTDNHVLGNFIGTNRAVSGSMANKSYGVFLSDTTGNFVGGAKAGEGNFIWYNGAAGVFVSAVKGGTRNLISHNSIYNNGGQGIDLAPAGVTANDHLDADTGANMLQNYPVLETARRSLDLLTLSGYLDSTPNSTFTLEFFGNGHADASGYGQGETFLGALTVTTGADGIAKFKTTLTAPAAVNQWISATATDVGNNTSEFSKSIVMAL